MSTVTIPTKEYKVLKQKAGLYDTVLGRSARNAVEIERYSAKRIQEFMEVDRVSKNMVARVNKILKPS